MIKFQMFDSANSYQCHFAEISTFVVSISHYMRAFFNYQALKLGSDFTLPSDAAFLDVSVLFFMRDTAVSHNICVSRSACMRCDRY